MGVQISFGVSVFISFVYIPRSGISPSYGSFNCNFLRLLHNGCTNLYSHQQCTKISSHPHQHLLFLVFLMMAIISYCGLNLHFPSDTGWWWVFFWCTCWPFIYLLWEKCLSRVSARFLIGLLWFIYFCYRVAWILCIFWILTPYQVYGLQIFFAFCKLSFYFVDCFFRCGEAS